MDIDHKYYQRKPPPAWALKGSEICSPEPLHASYNVAVSKKTKEQLQKGSGLTPSHAQYQLSQSQVLLDSICD